MNLAELCACLDDTPTGAQREAIAREARAVAHRALLAGGVGEVDADEAAQICAIRTTPHLLARTVRSEVEEAYVRAAAFNAYRDILRGRTRRREVAPDSLDQAAAPVLPAPDPRLAGLRALLDGDEMPANYRDAVRAMLDGVPPLTDIAKERGVDVGTVHRWASRGRAWLQRRLLEGAAPGTKGDE